MNQEHRESSKLVSIGRRSRWFAAELVIIIAGVLIALGIDEWRDGLEEAALEKVYLAQLIAELESTEAEVKERELVNAPLEQAANDILAAFETRDRPDLEEVRTLLFEMPQYTGPPPQLSTIESMIAAGDLGLIKDQNVRADITRYLGSIQNSWMIAVTQREDDHRQMNYKILLLAQTYGISPSYRRGHVRTDSGSSNEPDIEAFFNNAEAYAYVSALVFNRQIMLDYRVGLGARAKRLRESLEDYFSTL